MNTRHFLKRTSVHCLTAVLCFLAGFSFPREPNVALTSPSEFTSAPFSKLQATKHIHVSSDPGAIRMSQSPGTSDEEQAIVDHIDARAKRGWPVLLFELPEARRQSYQFIRNVSSNAAQSAKPAYDAFFGGLGFSSEDSEKAQSHIQNIHQASMEYELAQQQILLAKYHFEKELGSTLTSEQFEQFKQFEKGRKADQELVQIDSFSKTHGGGQFNGASRQILHELIRIHEAYTTPVSHGPFDSLPQVAVGRDQITHRLHELNEQRSKNATLFLDAMSQASIDASTQEILRKYYASMMEKRVNEIEFLRNKPELPLGQKPSP